VFFIFGSPRSGTTLLAQCLNAHPDVIVPHETDFIIPSAFVFDRVTDPALRAVILKPLITGSQGFTMGLGEYLSADEVCSIVDRHSGSLAELLTAIYGALTERAVAKLAGDKSPNDLLFLRMLLKLGGIPKDAKVIHLVRDVRAVVTSIAAHKLAPGIERVFARLWCSSNLLLYDELNGTAQYQLIRYEDFVREPTRSLGMLCKHLQISTASISKMLDPDRRHPRYRGWSNHARLYDPITLQEDHSCRDAHVIALCERQAAEALAVFGYDGHSPRSRPTPRQPQPGALSRALRFLALSPGGKR
jgi:hypothetical protein